VEIASDDKCNDVTAVPTVLLNNDHLTLTHNYSKATGWGKLAVDYSDANAGNLNSSATISVSLPSVRVQVVKSFGGCHLDLQMQVLRMDNAMEVEGLLVSSGHSQ
jgi:hypothetical protein